MSLHDLAPRHCHDCGAKPGEFHRPGCDVERCALCGSQSISCFCVYGLSGFRDSDDLEQRSPYIYAHGPTEIMDARYDAEVAERGGRLPWTGVWPGEEECIEYGFYCHWVSRDTGKVCDFATGNGRWQPCGKDDEGARPDLNTLVERCVWDIKRRKFVLP